MKKIESIPRKSFLNSREEGGKILLFHALHEKIYEGGRGLLEQVSPKILLFNSREGGGKMLLFHALHEKIYEMTARSRFPYNTFFYF